MNIVPRTARTAFLAALAARRTMAAAAPSPRPAPPPPPYTAYTLPQNLHATPTTVDLELPRSILPTPGAEAGAAATLESPRAATRPPPPPDNTAATTTTTAAGAAAAALPAPLPTRRPLRPLRPRRAAIKLSSAAVAQLRELLDGPEPRMIRIGVRNRGCSGLAYHLEYVAQRDRGQLDEEVEQDGVKVLVEGRALMSVIGSEMDWVEDRLSARFVFRNPNIKETCGCGESFSV